MPTNTLGCRMSPIGGSPAIAVKTRSTTKSVATAPSEMKDTRPARCENIPITKTNSWKCGASRYDVTTLFVSSMYSALSMRTISTVAIAIGSAEGLKMWRVRPS